MPSVRTRRIEPADPGGEPVCLLTQEDARARRVPIDRLLALGTIKPKEAGYEIRLPRGEENWTLANEFAEEEAACCASLGLEVEERDGATVVTATF